ncbi:MAG: DUF2924 domain-containing protein [Candidatus Omnitrophota bacterium]
MTEIIEERIKAFENMAVPDLQKEYRALFDGQKATSDNKVFLIRRLAYRLQELEYGSLSENAQTRLNEFIKAYDPVNNKALRLKPSPEADGKTKGRTRDNRLPIPGSIIMKEYKGKKIEVKVLEDGFEHNGKIYKHLSAIAKEITGAHWNGYCFFNL